MELVLVPHLGGHALQFVFRLLPRRSVTESHEAGEELLERSAARSQPRRQEQIGSVEVQPQTPLGAGGVRAPEAVPAEVSSG